MATVLRGIRGKGAAMFPREAPADPLSAALDEARGLIDEHGQALLRVYGQLRQTHRAHLIRLHEIEAQILAATQPEPMRPDARPAQSIEAHQGEEELQALRQEQAWLAERLMLLAAAARRIQAVARQTELTGSYLEGDLAEGGGIDELAELSQLHALQAQEDERRRLARDIHDGPAQVLANAIFELGYCRRLMTQDPSQADVALARLEGDLRTSLGEVRQFIHDLQPGAVAGLGLAVALQTYLDDYAQRTGIATRLDVDSSVERLPAPVELGIFRIVQEALQNARKHSQARQLTVFLAMEGAVFQVRVEDDGVGFDPEVKRAERGHFGLTSMSDRARLLRAELRLASAPGEGTRIELRVPISGDSIE